MAGWLIKICECGWGKLYEFIHVLKKRIRNKMISFCFPLTVKYINYKLWILFVAKNSVFVQLSQGQVGAGQ